MKRRKLLFGLLAYLLSIIIVSLLVSWSWLYLREYEEYKAVEILASREPDLGLAVYAQFNVSQEFEVQPVAEVTKIVLPLYLPENNRPISITLTSENDSLAEWNLNNAEKNGVFDIELKLDTPIKLAGKYQININGHDISHADKDKAPRVFVEKDDGKYLGGNYFIAGNKKTGDMSMQAIGQRTRWQKLLNDAETDPLQQIITVMIWLLLIITAGVGPHVLLRHLGRLPTND